MEDYSLIARPAGKGFSDSFLLAEVAFLVAGPGEGSGAAGLAWVVAGSVSIESDFETLISEN